jgi:hypothetical protein
MTKLQKLHLAFSALLSCCLVFAPFANPHLASANSGSQNSNQIHSEPIYHHHLQEAADSGYFVLRSEGEQIACQDALPDEVSFYNQRDPDEELRILQSEASSIQAQAANGLTIILRATSQLDANTPAKAAFVRAADAWQTLIKSPITIYIDVDFGPTRFGQAYSQGVIGATGTQSVGSATLYSDTRQRLVNSAQSQPEINIYNSLPQGSMPTELGSTTGVVAPTSVFRSLGLLAANADVGSEVTQLGNPPAIGFNSAFDFDFDSSDGIDADKFDFYGVALHEIGHALGFTSSVGTKELSPLSQVAVSLLDIFRLRPGTTINSFSMAPRVLSSGGEQVFFAGGAELALSSGRPDVTGGDERQASHWKDDLLTQQYLGIMDPTARRGQRLDISQNDLDALAFIGHAIGNVPPPMNDTILLSSGNSQTGSMGAPAQGSCTLNLFQYAITVPSGATQLRIDLNGSPELDLFVRLNQRVSIQSGLPLRDFAALTPGGNETLTIVATSTPALQAGTYYIAIGNCGTGQGNFSITATVSPTGGDGGGGTGSAPVITSLAARLDGDFLRLTGAATDADGDIAKMRFRLFDSAEVAVVTSPELPVSFGATTTANLSIFTTGMTQTVTLAAVKCELILIDSKGNRSAAANANFNQADAGGANLRSASFDPTGLMILKGSGFTSPAELEINGVLVTPPLRAKVKSDAKIKIGGTAAELGLRTGVNRVRLRTGNLYSNITLLTQ